MQPLTPPFETTAHAKGCKRWSEKFKTDLSAVWSRERVFWADADACPGTTIRSVPLVVIRSTILTVSPMVASVIGVNCGSELEKNSSMKSSTEGALPSTVPAPEIASWRSKLPPGALQKRGKTSKKAKFWSKQMFAKWFVLIDYQLVRSSHRLVRCGIDAFNALLQDSSVGRSWIVCFQSDRRLINQPLLYSLQSYFRQWIVKLASYLMQTHGVIGCTVDSTLSV